MISKNNWEITILFDILCGDFMSYVDQFGDFMSGDFMSGDFLTGYQKVTKVSLSIIIKYFTSFEKYETLTMKKKYV